MKKNTIKELLYVLLSLVPYGYLALTYSTLSATVPTHFNIHGKANGWSSRESLWLIPAALPLISYLLFLVLPLIDPKQKLRRKQGRFEHIRFILVLFMIGLACFMLYTAQNQSMEHLDKMLFAFLGLFFAALGNFFPALKPNYFIGIRSPWALENEVVWKKTHQFGGKLWVGGGLLILLLAFVLPPSVPFDLVFLPLVLCMAFIPFVYSYFLWRRIKTTATS
ncbi:SdpI family protein [Taibaiella koreensis]|uniref:SdpI family protein n=1 Tax=Taibaiella koreensis TaxID=1268548 RepID=UPI000E5A0B1C|nr:SdpI family protein [Taibaiella koreensis]